MEESSLFDIRRCNHDIDNCQDVVGNYECRNFIENTFIREGPDKGGYEQKKDS